MEKHIEWWNSLTPEQQDYLKKQYHEFFQLQFVKDLSDIEKKVVYKRRFSDEYMGFETI